VSEIPRCEAAHPHDASPCDGPRDAVTLIDASGTSVTGCEHHAARALASTCGVAVTSGPGHDGAALRVVKAAQGIAPFAWMAAQHAPAPMEGTDPGGRWAYSALLSHSATCPACQAGDDCPAADALSAECREARRDPARA